MIPIFDTTLKGKKQVKKYMRALHHESVLFLQSRNLFFYVPDNEIEGDILGWTTSVAVNLHPHRRLYFSDWTKKIAPAVKTGETEYFRNHEGSYYDAMPSVRGKNDGNKKKIGNLCY